MDTKLRATFRRCSITVRHGFGKPLWMWIPQGNYMSFDATRPGEVLLCMKMYRGIRYGQLSLCNVSDNPFWMYEHCRASPTRSQILMSYIWTNEMFRNQIQKECARALLHSRMTPELFGYASHFKLLRKTPQYQQYKHVMLEMQRRRRRRKKHERKADDVLIKS